MSRREEIRLNLETHLTFKILQFWIYLRLTETISRETSSTDTSLGHFYWSWFTSDMHDAASRQMTLLLSRFVSSTRGRICWKLCLCDVLHSVRGPNAQCAFVFVFSGKENHVLWESKDLRTQSGQIVCMNNYVWHSLLHTAARQEKSLSIPVCLMWTDISHCKRLSGLFNKNPEVWTSDDQELVKHSKLQLFWKKKWMRWDLLWGDKVSLP